MELTLAIFHRTSRRTRSTTTFVLQCSLLPTRRRYVPTPTFVLIILVGTKRLASRLLLHVAHLAGRRSYDEGLYLVDFTKGRLHHYRGELGVGRALRYGESWVRRTVGQRN